MSRQDQAAAVRRPFGTPASGGVSRRRPVMQPPGALAGPVRAAARRAGR